MKPGTKHDRNKTEWHLLPWVPVQEVVRVLQHGADKYAADNWKHVEPARVRYWNAAMRHMLAWFDGEAQDPGSGCNHLAHAACCMLFLMWHQVVKKPPVESERKEVKRWAVWDEAYTK
jgi:hypothetical protein